MSKDRKIYTADEIAKLIKVSKAAERVGMGRAAKPEEIKNAADAKEAIEIELFTAALLTLQAFVQSFERIADALEKSNTITRERL